MRRVTKISPNQVSLLSSEPHLGPSVDLFCRSRELLHFSIVCLVNGGYAEAKILLRAAFENAQLIKLFAIKPDLAKEWIFEPEKFKNQWTPSKVRRTVVSQEANLEVRNGSDRIYANFCEYTHPSFNGWMELLRKQDNTILISAIPEFNAEYASECIGLICFLMIETLGAYFTVYIKYLSNETCEEAKKLLPKIYEIVIRHFQLRTYNKKLLLD